MFDKKKNKIEELHKSLEELLRENRLLKNKYENEKRFSEMITKLYAESQEKEEMKKRYLPFDVVTDGLKHDGGEPRLDLVPPEIIEAVGVVMTHGVEKYGEASYRNVEPKRYRAALMRHICKWLKDPYGKDEDSGLPHLWHVACNVAFLLELDSKKE